MKVIPYIVILLAYAYGFVHVGPIAAGVGVLVLSLLVYMIWKRYRYIRKLKDYAERIDNIYVLSEKPGDRTVAQRTIAEKEMLEKSGNKRGVRIVQILFQDGEFVNETWEEYQERAKEEIAEDRKSRHAKLKKEDPEWYLCAHHRQKGVSI